MAQEMKGLGLSILFLLAIALVYAPPPTPHSVSGYVYYPGDVQVPLGTDYSLNNTNTSFYERDVTSSPATGKSGWYSVKVEGTDGDDIHLLAWNSTAYAEVNDTLNGSMTIDLYLNRTRPPEINLTITYPANDTLFNITDNFDVNASINILGGFNAENCSFQISFNESVLSLRTGEVYIHNYSELSYGSTFIESWNLTASGNGSTSITVNSTCDTDSLNFEDLTQDTISNIMVNDTGAPIVSIMFPGNNTQNISSNTLLFKYNVSDDSSILNCTLFVNGQYKNHTVAPSVDTPHSLWAYLSNALYNWTINCTDSGHTTGTAGRYNLSVAVYSPWISLIQIQDPVNLLSGDNKEVVCNGSAKDSNGFANINTVNATLYYIDGNFNASSPDNNNSHYSADCQTSNGAGDILDYECLFNVTYYAPAGEWQCNVSAFDAQAHENHSTTNTNVSELYAISLPAELDFGLVIPNHVSDEKSTNVINEGNVDINISVRGYGNKEGDNLAMVCERGNVSVNAQRYNASSGTAYSSMYELSNDFAKIPHFLISKSTGTQSLDTVYWRVQPGFGLAGSCNGTVIFSVVIG